MPLVYVQEDRASPAGQLTGREATLGDRMKRDKRDSGIGNADDQDARGIVIRPGSDKPAPVACWAYLWSADDDAADHHWHELVPVTRAP